MATIEKVRGLGPYDLAIGLVGSEDSRSKNPLLFTGKLSLDPEEPRKKFKAIVTGIVPEDEAGERWRVSIKVTKAEGTFAFLLGSKLEGVYNPKTRKGNFSLIG